MLTQCVFYLDVSDELQSWSFYGCLAVYDSLYGSRPPHGLIQHLGIKAVWMFPPIHYYVPVAWRQDSINIYRLKIVKNANTVQIFKFNGDKYYITVHVVLNLLCIILI